MSAVKKKHTRVILIIVSVVVLLLIAAAAILRSLALTDHEQEYYTLTEQSDTFLTTMLKGTAFGKEFTISETEFNTYINKRYCRKPEDGWSDGIDHLRVYFHKDRPCEVYAHVFYDDLQFSVHSLVSFQLGSISHTMKLKFTDAYIGQLKIDENITGLILNKLFSRHSFATPERNTLLVKAEYSYELKNTSIDMELLDFEPEENAIRCRTNSLTGEAMKAFKEYITSEEGKEKLRDIYDGFKNKIRSLFHDDE